MHCLEEIEFLLPASLSIPLYLQTGKLQTLQSTSELLVLQERQPHLVGDIAI